MKKLLTLTLGSLLAVAAAAPAAVITVTTINNEFPQAGKSLVQAIEEARDGDTIAFNIPGDGPHYIKTLPTGYPLIRAQNLTIDGYTQTGASPNNNPIHAPNNAKLQIVLDSREGGRTVMEHYANDEGRGGYGTSETAILGVVNAANITIRGLCFLGKHTENSDADPGIYCIAFARDHTGAPNYDNNSHISGCWFAVEPDGVTVSGGSATAVSAFRHRDVNGGPLPELPNHGMTIGVKAGSSNPRAEFNVMVDMEYGLAGEQTGVRFSGNFLGVLPDGMTAWDQTDRPLEAGLETGRYNNSTIVIGTDGDDVNDADEGNVFGPLAPGATILAFYSTGNKQYVIAGNYFGVAVDGVTPLLGSDGITPMSSSFRIAETFGRQCKVRIGTDFDGVSDLCEGNLIVNNTPFDSAATLFNPIRTDNPDVNGVVRLALRGNRLINNYPLPVNLSGGTQPDPTTFYEPYLEDDTVITPIIELATAERIVGTVPVAKNTIVATVIDLYVVDGEGIANGQSLLLPGLPFGFLQGKRYIRSFVLDSPADLDNSAPGRFEFNLAGLNIGGGDLTLTANYLEDPIGTHNGRAVTSPFSDPFTIGFTPGGIESAGLRRVVPDQTVFVNSASNLDNWEPFSSVIGNSVFVVEANTHAMIDGEGGPVLDPANQNYAVAFQPVDGGAHTTGAGFYGDEGIPFLGKINKSRQNGNPGRVAADRRPGAINFMVGGEASPHTIEEFSVVDRWQLGFDRLSSGRYATVQSYCLSSGLKQTPLSVALDAINGRLDATVGPPPDAQIGRFGGEIVCLDNGNFVVVVHDRSRVRNPAGDATTAVILRPDGAIVKESFMVDPRDIWSNVASYRGGFCVRVHETLYFYSNDGTLTGKVNQRTSFGRFDEGRGDGARIAAHINSPFVFLAGQAAGAVRVAAFDSRTAKFAGLAVVNEPGFTPALDRVTVAADALDRVAVVYEAKPAPEYVKFQTLVRVLAYDAKCQAFAAITPSFFAFTNNAPADFRTVRPSISMTTREILVVAKGEINSLNEVQNGPDTSPQTTFYTVFSHPVPMDDPTTPAVLKLAIAHVGNNAVISWPASFAGFTLESKRNLGDANWTPVGTQNPATVALDGQRNFFRLRK